MDSVKKRYEVSDVSAADFEMIVKNRIDNYTFILEGRGNFANVDITGTALDSNVIVVKTEANSEKPNMTVVLFAPRQRN